MVGKQCSGAIFDLQSDLIVVLHLEKFLYGFFATGRNTLDMQSLYTGSSCPLFYFVRQTILIITNVNPLLFDASYVYLKQVVGN